MYSSICGGGNVQCRPRDSICGANRGQSLPLKSQSTAGWALYWYSVHTTLGEDAQPSYSCDTSDQETTGSAASPTRKFEGLEIQPALMLAAGCGASEQGRRAKGTAPFTTVPHEPSGITLVRLGTLLWQHTTHTCSVASIII